MPNGFLLDGGGVACVGDERMPDGLGDELEGRGHKPKESGCFDAVEPGPECFYDAEPNPNPGDDPAFDLDGATTLSFSATGGFGFCPEPNSVVEFEIDVATRAVSAQVLILGQDGSDRCEQTADDVCLVRETTSFEITEDELAQAIELLEAVPAPNCQNNFECDACLVESLAVDDTSVTSVCCGDQLTEGFDDAFLAAADYLRGLMPENQPAFDNSTTFDELTLTKNGGLGFCIEPGDLHDATITRDDANNLTFEGSVVEIGDIATDDCLQTPDTDECLVATPIGPQSLTADAQAELERLLGELPAPMCVIDQGMACDPCLITNVALDGNEVSSYCCGTTAIGFDEAFTAVVNHLESL